MTKEQKKESKKNGMKSADVLLPKLRQLRKDKEAIEEQIAEIQSELISEAESAGLDKVSYFDSDSGESFDAEIRQSSRSKFNIPKTKKAVSPEIWEEISFEDVDRSAVDMLIEAGRLPADFKERVTVKTYGRKFLQ